MDAETVERVAVVGAGPTGRGVAEVAALGGMTVALRGLTAADAAEGRRQIGRHLDDLVERGRIRRDAAEATLARVEPYGELAAAVADADLVVEAVPDRQSVRRDVYGSLAGLPPARAVLATAAPGVRVADVASLGDRPDRTCGLRTFPPAVARRVVEVVGGPATAPATLSLVAGVAERLGREVIRLPDDPPGGVVDRVLAPTVNEAAWLVTEGVAPAAVDASARAAAVGVGPLSLADRFGLGRCLSVLEHLADDNGETYEPAPALRERAADGPLGPTPGGGFHDGTDEADADADEAQGRRLVAVFARETAALDAAGVADPRTTDRAVGLATGVPRGPARLADDAGVDALVAALDAAREATGHPRYAAGALRDRTDRPFYGADTLAAGVRGERLPDRPGVARVVVDRPGRANALDVESVRAVARWVEAFAADDEVRAVVVTGAGGTFCAGVDLGAAPLRTRDREAATDFARAGQRALARVARADVPVVAAIAGACLGAGLTLAACADLRVATEGATFGHPARHLGLAPAWGGTVRLPAALGDGRARELLLTGARYDAARLRSDGFLTAVVGDGPALRRRALTLAAGLADASPAAISAVRGSLRAGREASAEALDAEAEAFGRLAVTDEARAALRAYRA
ncbi:MAG: enoyl-CoA hydratase-related protein [Haloferacaceae archaeon]